MANRLEYQQGQFKEIAAAEVSSGSVKTGLPGNRIGVSLGLDKIAAGQPVVYATAGIFSMDATEAEVYAVGDVLYWKAGTSKVTSDDETGSNPRAGVCMEAKPAGNTKALVDLNVVDVP